MKVTGDFPVGSYPGVSGETFLLASATPTPPNMLECAGQQLATGKHQYLEQFMGTRFGGGTNTYNMPNLRSKSPDGLDWMLTVDGSQPESPAVRDTFIGELLLVPFELTRGYSRTLCDGKELYAPQMPVLYDLLGNRFGGTNPRFNLPDLRGATPSQFNYYINLEGLRPQRP
jgi:microcystin-dependent protein